MMNSENEAEATRQPKWFNSPVIHHLGTLKEIETLIPTFERRAFALTQPGDNFSRLNGRLDAIVRKPFGDDPSFIPVGIVSKEYALVQHTEVFEVAVKAFEKAKIELSNVDAEIELTEYGERMALTLFLPDTFSFDPGDGHTLRLRLECFNSVDGSTRFRILMGWFRLVCSNGLIVGITRSDVRRRHVGDISLSDVGKVLNSGIKVSEKEKGNLIKWRNCVVQPNKFSQWIGKNLHKEWGFKAAARAYHIYRTGYDADVLGPYKDNTPTTIPMLLTKHVPGMPGKSNNLYDVSQILAWLARERRDVQEQLEWREQIPKLLKPLMT